MNSDSLRVKTHKLFFMSGNHLKGPVKRAPHCAACSPLERGVLERRRFEGEYRGTGKQLGPRSPKGFSVSWE